MINLLRKDLLSGISYSEIARDINSTFGTELTRNAVIGKCNRMGLEQPEPLPGQQRRGPQRVKRGPKTSVQRIRVAQTSKPLPKEPEVPKPENQVSLADLRDGICKWPVGEFYCGTATAGPRIVYCEFHRDIARRQASGNSQPIGMRKPGRINFK